jgi:hypothetical protein
MKKMIIIYNSFCKVKLKSFLTWLDMVQNNIKYNMMSLKHTGTDFYKALRSLQKFIQAHQYPEMSTIYMMATSGNGK